MGEPKARLGSAPADPGVGVDLGREAPAPVLCGLPLQFGGSTILCESDGAHVDPLHRALVTWVTVNGRLRTITSMSVTWTSAYDHAKESDVSFERDEDEVRAELMSEIQGE